MRDVTFQIGDLGSSNCGFLGRGSSNSHVLTTVYRTLAIRFARLAIQLSTDHDPIFQSLYCDMRIDRGPCFHQDLQTAFMNRVCGRMTDCCMWLRWMVIILLTLIPNRTCLKSWHILISGVQWHINSLRYCSHVKAEHNLKIARGWTKEVREALGIGRKMFRKNKT